MKTVFTAILVVLSLLSGVAYAEDGCTDTSWAINAAKSGDLEQLYDAYDKANLCIVDYAREAIKYGAINRKTKAMLKNDPSNKELQSLAASSEVVVRTSLMLAKDLERVRVVLGSLINILETKNAPSTPSQSAEPRKPEISL